MFSRQRLATVFFESTDSGRASILEATDSLAASLMDLAPTLYQDPRTYFAFEPVAASSVTLYRQLQARGAPQDWLHLMEALHLQGSAHRIVNSPLAERSWTTSEEALNVARTVEGNPSWLWDCHFCSQPLLSEANMTTVKRILSIHGVRSLDLIPFLSLASFQHPLQPSIDFGTLATADRPSPIPLRIEDPNYAWGFNIGAACGYADSDNPSTINDYKARVPISKCLLVLGESYLEGRKFQEACLALCEALVCCEESINTGLITRLASSRKAMKLEVHWFVEGLHAYGIALCLAGRVSESCDVFEKLFFLIRVFESRSIRVGQHLGILLNHYGTALHSLKNFSKAVDVFQVGYASFSERRLRSYRAGVLQGRACSLYRLGALDAARQSFDEGVFLLRDKLSENTNRARFRPGDHADVLALAFLFRDSGIFSLETGDMTRALEALGQSFNLFWHMAKLIQLELDDEIDYIKELSTAADIYSSSLRSEDRLVDAINVHKKAADLMPATSRRGR